MKYTVTVPIEAWVKVEADDERQAIDAAKGFVLGKIGNGAVVAEPEADAFDVEDIDDGVRVDLDVRIPSATATA